MSFQQELNEIDAERCGIEDRSVFNVIRAIRWLLSDLNDRIRDLEEDNVALRSKIEERNRDV